MASGWAAAVAVLALAAPPANAQNLQLPRTPAAAVQAVMRHFERKASAAGKRFGFDPQDLPASVADSLSRTVTWRFTNYEAERVCVSRIDCEFRNVDVLVRIIAVEQSEDRQITFRVNVGQAVRHESGNRLFFSQVLVTVRLGENGWAVTREDVVFLG